MIRSAARLSIIVIVIDLIAVTFSGCTQIGTQEASSGDSVDVDDKNKRLFVDLGLQLSQGDGWIEKKYICDGLERSVRVHFLPGVFFEPKLTINDEAVLGIEKETTHQQEVLLGLEWTIAVMDNTQVDLSLFPKMNLAGHQILQLDIKVDGRFNLSYRFSVSLCENIEVHVVDDGVYVHADPNLLARLCDSQLFDLGTKSDPDLMWHAKKYSYGQLEGAIIVHAVSGLEYPPVPTYAWSKVQEGGESSFAQSTGVADAVVQEGAGSVFKQSTGIGDGAQPYMNWNASVRGVGSFDFYLYPDATDNTPDSLRLVVKMGNRLVLSHGFIAGEDIEVHVNGDEIYMKDRKRHQITLPPDTPPDTTTPSQPPEPTP